MEKYALTESEGGVLKAYVLIESIQSALHWVMTGTEAECKQAFNDRFNIVDKEELLFIVEAQALFQK